MFHFLCSTQKQYSKNCVLLKMKRTKYSHQNRNNLPRNYLHFHKIQGNWPYRSCSDLDSHAAANNNQCFNCELVLYKIVRWMFFCIGPP